MSRLRRSLPLFTLAVAIGALYLYALDGVGVLLPDEPRYTAIGRAMAQTGDWITPRLWGAPWFEKPALYYWMTAVGCRLGLNPDLAGRLPVALLSLGFIVFFFWRIQKLYTTQVAALAAVLLATSAGWLAYSNLGLTDIPLSVFFSMAVLFALSMIRTGGSGAARLASIGICLGLATLAKGLVPLALAAPFAWFLRTYWRQWWIAAGCCLLVAGPWYLLVYLRNGYPFIQEFFLKHHFARLYSGSLQHVQPWYFYLPILVFAIFPWSPLIIVLASKQVVHDMASKFLLAVIGWGLVFFSISLNKLPGYLLPLLPSLFLLVGLQYKTKPLAVIPRGWMLACAGCISLIPLITKLLPKALTGTRITVNLLTQMNRVDVFLICLPLAAAVLSRRSWTGLVLCLCLVCNVFYLKTTVYPLLDQEVSARGLWRSLARQRSTLCDAGLHRNWQYGMAFYNVGPLAACSGKPGETQLSQEGNQVPSVRMLPY